MLERTSGVQTPAGLSSFSLVVTTFLQAVKLANLYKVHTSLQTLTDRNTVQGRDELPGQAVLFLCMLNIYRLGGNSKDMKIHIFRDLLFVFCT